MPKSGRLILITSVLCAVPIHAMLALDIPPKTLSAMARICRGFLWCGKKEARGGKRGGSLGGGLHDEVGWWLRNPQSSLAEQGATSALAMAAKGC